MDPHATLREQREIAERLTTLRELLDTVTGPAQIALSDGERLAELVLALDDWRGNGGFDPYAAPARRASEFTLRVELGNAAMQDSHDVADALRGCAEHLDERGFDGDAEGRVRDANGNTVGQWDLSEGAEAEVP